MPRLRGASHLVIGPVQKAHSGTMPTQLTTALHGTLEEIAALNQEPSPTTAVAELNSIHLSASGQNSALATPRVFASVKLSVAAV